MKIKATFIFFVLIFLSIMVVLRTVSKSQPDPLLVKDKGTNNIISSVFSNN
jgi:hypothetical protein